MGAWANAIKSGADQSTALWLKFKEERPALALALSVLPVSGQVTAAAEYYDAMKRGDSTDGVMAALQFLPLGGAVKGAKLANEAMGAARSSKAAMQEAARVFGPELHAQSDGIGWMNHAQEMSKQARIYAGEAAVATSGDVQNVAEYMNNPSSAWAAAMKGNQ